MESSWVASGPSPPQRRVNVKLITMGNASVGKSCLIKRYCERRFAARYQPTVGLDYGLWHVDVKDYAPLSCNIFDFSGNPHFYEVRNEFYKDTQIALLVYDVNNRKSFKALEVWLQEMKTALPGGGEISRIVFGVCCNKVDSSAQRSVSENEGRIWAGQKGFHYFETSTLTGNGIDEMFQTLFDASVLVLKGGSGRAEPSYTNQELSKEQKSIIARLHTGKDDFDKLGLQRTADKQTVERAFRKIAKLLHPDKVESEGSEDAFKLASSAKERVLKIIESK